MSLPSAYASDDEYFGAAVDFLQRYAWVYREANTSCIKSLDQMPKEFKDFFLEISNDSLNIFPFVHKPLDHCPEIVQHFRQKIGNLTPNQREVGRTFTAKEPKKSTFYNRKIAEKKLYEIEKLAANIHEYCAETELIIDLGSGLGYLSEALLKLNNNYLILGLEADEKRVETARKRCQELLPQEIRNSISYKQEFITADSLVCIEQDASELANSNGLIAAPKTAIIGLHACADLSISAMLLFLKMTQVRYLHIMPCCYHKLALREGLTFSSCSATSSCFVNFPLSSRLREALTGVADACFNRPFMRLACQETKSRWINNSQSHAEHGQRMFYRALADALCDVDELVKAKRTDKQLTIAPKDRLTFSDIQQRYELHSQRKDLSAVNWRPIHEARFTEISERYGERRGSLLAEGLCCLQATMQNLCENLVLYDRLCYLKEIAGGQQLRLEARYEKLFDEKLSPRCYVLIAEKL